MKKLYYTLGVLAILIAGLLFSGNGHIFPTLRHTILKGRLGPEIDEYASFPNREVKAGAGLPWAESLVSAKLNDDELAFHNDLKSVAFVVIRRDTIRFEQYWEGYGASSKSNSFSMAKSLVNVALGAAIQDGYITSLDQTLDEFIPELEGGEKVSLRNLLKMSSGINFDEHYINPFAYPARANYGSDLWALTTSYKADGIAGEEFSYLSGNSQLLAFVISRATGKSLSDYFSERVWQRIGAEQAALWTLDRVDGYEKAFCCFNSNARDFARIGKLYLNKGRWNEVQIVPEWYVKESVSRAGLLGKLPEASSYYGYQWWMLDYKGKEVFYARGILGQYVLVVPEDELIVCRLGHKRLKPKVKQIPPGGLEAYLDMAYRLTSAQPD